MFITKKHLSRRLFLRAAGASLGLPFLDAMVPALVAQAKAAPRLSFIYLPHGAIMDQWTPKKDGTNFELTPILSSSSLSGNTSTSSRAWRMRRPTPWQSIP